MRDEREDAVEKVLTALGRAEAPDGLEARIAECLERKALVAQKVEFGWMDVVRGSAMSGVWWRGAVSGAAASLLLVGGMMAVGHWMRGPAGSPATQGERVVGLPGYSGGVPGSALPAGMVSGGRGEPCTAPAMVRVGGKVAVQRRDSTQVERAVVRGYPVFQPTLTAQERALVQLAQQVDPKQLADLDPEMRAKMEAQDAAEFESFFAAPPKSTGDEE